MIESVANAIQSVRHDISIASHLLSGDVIPSTMPRLTHVQGKYLHGL